MKKILILSTILASISFAGSVTNINELEKQETRRKEVVASLEPAINKITEHTKKYNDNIVKFAKFLADNGIEKAVEEANRTNKDVNITFTDIEKTLTKIKESYVKADTREKEAKEPSRVIFNDLANELKTLSLELENKLKPLNKGFEKNEFISFLKEGYNFSNDFYKLALEEKTLVENVGTRRNNASDSLKSAANEYVYNADTSNLAVNNPLIAMQRLNDNQNIRIVENRVDINKNAMEIEKTKIELKETENRLNNSISKTASQLTAMNSVDFTDLEEKQLGVAVGIGKHKKEEAIALGLAYKPNRKFTFNTKIGVNTNDKLKNSTFGAGALYKFDLK